MLINLIGWYGNGNLGDECFKDSFKTNLPNHELIFSEKPEKDCDVRIFGGGGSPVKYLIRGEKWGLLTKEEPLYGIGIDIPIHGDQWDILTSFNFKEILCRSHKYFSVAQNRGDNWIMYCPDLAFGLPPVEHKPKRSISSGKKTLGVILTYEYIQNPDIRWELSRALKVLARTYDIYFLPLKLGVYYPDGIYNRIASVEIPGLKKYQFLDGMEGSPYPRVPSDAMKIISSFDIVLSMRFHGIIFSTLMGVPFISLANKGKHSLFCTQEEIDQLFIDISNSNLLRDIVEKIDMVYNNREIIKVELEKISDKNRLLVKDSFNYINQKWLTK